MLQAKLTGQRRAGVAVKPTNNPEAYDAYLRGLAYTLKTFANTPPTLLAHRNISKKRCAWIRSSPLVGRCCHTLMRAVTSHRVFNQRLALREEARQAAETALTLQPNLGEAVLAKGYYYYYCLKDYDTAVRYFEQARQLLPNSSRIPEVLAYLTRRRGQWDRSEAYFNEAERLDPRNVNLLTQHAITYICLRRFPEALRKLDEVLDITPDDLGYPGDKGGYCTSAGRPAACLGAARSAPLRRPMTPRPWKHKFTRRSWSAVLHR